MFSFWGTLHLEFRFKAPNAPSGLFGGMLSFGIISNSEAEPIQVRLLHTLSCLDLIGSKQAQEHDLLSTSSLPSHTRDEISTIVMLKTTTASSIWKCTSSCNIATSPVWCVFRNASVRWAMTAAMASDAQSSQSVARFLETKTPRFNFSDLTAPQIGLAFRERWEVILLQQWTFWSPRVFLRSRRIES